MARTFLTTVNLSNNSLLNGRIDARWSAAPGAAITNPDGNGTAVQGQLSSFNGAIYVFTGANGSPSGAPANTWLPLTGNLGTVTAVGAAAPLSSTGGTTPQISIAAATTSASGAVQLNDAINNTSTTQAATANAARTAYDRGSQGITDAAAAATTANAALSRAGGTMTGFITTHADPTTDLHVANKRYVDSVASGLDVKQSVRAASTSSFSGVTYTATAGPSGRGQLTLAPTTLDGVTLVQGNRVLLKEFGSASNGIYVVTTLGTGANGVWDRASDFDTDAEVNAGAYVWVEEGTENQDSAWVLTTNNPIIIGGASGTGLTWGLFASTTGLIAGNGLTKSGGAINVVGTANRIVANTDSIDIASTYVGQNTITTLGTVGTGTWNGSLIGGQWGGTGVNNGLSTITLGGNLTTSGAFATIIRSTAATDVTLPTSGTLATTSQLTGMARKATGSVTLVANTPANITHNLNSQAVLVQVFTSTWELVEMDVTNNAVNTTALTSSVPGTFNWVAIG